MRVIATVLISALALVASGDTGAKPWKLNATIIEACTCPMFCQCYFNSHPAGHHEQGGEKHFCKFNNAFKVNRGSYGSVKLDGAKFWVSGDLGSDFSGGEMDWAVVTFDKATTKEQREAIGAILGHVYPVKWKSLQTTNGNIDTWQYTTDSAVATIDGGKTAEVRLKRPAGSAGGPGPIVVKNLKYFGVPRNDGFVMMTNEVQAYRVGEQAYESKGTNGFVITIDMNSNDVIKPGGMGKSSMGN